VSLRVAHLARRADLRSPEPPPIRLLIVDDSSVARAVLSRILSAQEGLEVVATAGGVSEALAQLRAITVDVILLDLQMPGEGGLKALPSIIRAGRGARVLIVSSVAEEGAEAAITALALGAADTMPKPGAGVFGRFGEQLAERVRRIGRSNAPDCNDGSVATRDVAGWQPSCIAIGASTGGIHAVHELITGLPKRVGMPILVTQHLPPLFMPFFARQLASGCGRPARVVSDGERVDDEHIHVAPGNAHLRLFRHKNEVRVKLDASPAPSGCLPSVDPMIASVAEVYGRGGVAVMLSGMGRDGLVGSTTLVRSGGVVLAQDEASSAIWGMPRAVAEAGLATAILPPQALARRIAAQIEGGAWK
jgi:two-component system, chemotaxis family, protein-glutamate methylesterase/glutaminase